MEKPEIAAEIINTMPEADEVFTDGRGDTYDKGLHLMGEDGKPAMTKRGFFRKKRGGVSTIAAVDTPSEDLSFKACGSSTAEIIFIMGQSIGGQEWQPTPDERHYMSDAWTQYYKAKDVKDLPPGLIVATALISYSMPRFAKPITRNRLQRASHWLKMKLSRSYRESHSDSRHDGERKEHTGNAVSASV